jgi:hypothetical protein
VRLVYDHRELSRVTTVRSRMTQMSSRHHDFTDVYESVEKNTIVYIYHDGHPLECVIGGDGLLSLE